MEIAITGGGIAGLCAAIVLQRAGIPYTVYEAAPEIKPVGAGIALAANAMKALAVLDMEPAIMAKGRLLDAFTIKDSKGRIISHVDSRSVRERYGADNFTIHRADLHQVLLSFIDQRKLQTNKRCRRAEQHEGKVVLHFTDGTRAEADHLLVCDGIRSPVREQLLPGALPRYAGYTCWRAVIDFPGPRLTEVTETWGTRGRFGIAPLTGNEVYWFACLNTAEGNEAMKKYQIADLLRHFGDFHTPVPELLAHTRNDQLIHGDIYDLVPLKKFAYGNILLMGDAAHATTPNMGQGACQAIEDAVVLGLVLKQYGVSEMAFEAFEKRRLQRTRMVTERSRTIGSIAQWENPVLAAARNFLFRCLPQRAGEKALKSLLDVDFKE